MLDPKKRTALTGLLKRIHRDESWIILIELAEILNELERRGVAFEDILFMSKKDRLRAAQLIAREMLKEEKDNETTSEKDTE